MPIISSINDMNEWIGNMHTTFYLFKWYKIQSAKLFSNVYITIGENVYWKIQSNSK